MYNSHYSIEIVKFIIPKSLLFYLKYNPISKILTVRMYLCNICIKYLFTKQFQHKTFFVFSILQNNIA